MAKKTMTISLDECDYATLMELKNKTLMGRYSTSAIIATAITLMFNASKKKEAGK